LIDENALAVVNNEDQVDEKEKRRQLKANKANFIVGSRLRNRPLEHCFTEQRLRVRSPN